MSRTIQPFTHDRETLAAQFDAFGPLVYSFAHRLTHEAIAAETIVQDVFKNLSRTYIADQNSLSSWLLLMTRKSSLQHLNASAIDEPLAVEALRWQEKRDSVHHAFSFLTDKQKTLVQWFYFDGLSQYSIAKRLSMPQKTVNNQIRLALQQLKPQINRGQEKLHAKVSGNLVDYLNAHLPANEMAAFEQHLATCSICQSELADWHALTEDLPYLSDQKQVPSGIKERLLEAVYGEEPPEPEDVDTLVIEEPVEEVLKPTVEHPAASKEKSRLPILAAALVLAVGASALLSPKPKKKAKL
ncbi:sigma-70 family RNA polymerase sigma factor [Planococcus sp. YIM B11945]|uniref:sigma-70 family RNA polymerase sigma factor n=1 Tax=Planococcus sp. YIM B11945 TaxID=3435410 RepID=UPI003D7EAE03